MVDVLIEILAFHFLSGGDVDDLLDRNPLDSHVREHGAVVGAALEVVMVYLREAGATRLRDGFAAVQQVGRPN